MQNTICRYINNKNNKNKIKKGFFFNFELYIFNLNFL